MKSKIIKIIKFGINPAKSERTKKAVRNIYFGFFIKGISILCNLLIVPLALGLIGEVQYGILITIFTTINWLSFFDIGISNALRNRFAESLAKGKHRLAKIYVSTTFVFLIMVMIPVGLILLYIVRQINWQSLLNTEVSNQLIINSISIVVILFAFQFIFQIVKVVLQASQKPAKASSILMISNIITVIILYLISLIKNDFININLFEITFIYYLPIVLSLIIGFIVLFNGSYKKYKPSIFLFSKKCFSRLFNLSWNFFVIQIAAVVIFMTTNFIISYLLGPEYVTQYTILFKYFNTVFMLFTIVVLPYWSAITDALNRKDVLWIRNSMKNLRKACVLFSLLLLLLFFISKPVISLWIGNVYNYDIILALLIFLAILIRIWVLPFSQFFNGTGFIKLSFYLSIIQMIVFIPLAFFMGKFFGLKGIIITISFIEFLGLAIFPIKYRNIMQKLLKYPNLLNEI